VLLPVPEELPVVPLLPDCPRVDAVDLPEVPVVLVEPDLPLVEVDPLPDAVDLAEPVVLPDVEALIPDLEVLSFPEVFLLSVGIKKLFV
jgi:hypothetical protein